MRGTLGIYSDDVFWVVPTPSGTSVSTDQAFLVFACAVGEHFDGLTLLGRTRRAPQAADHVLPSGVELAELPDYESLRRPGQMLRSSLGTITGMWRALGRLDRVWVLGPNPFGVALIGLALLRRKSLALGVRQDTVPYYRSRLPTPRWKVALPLVKAMDQLYRLLALRLPTTVVGDDLAHGYAPGRRTVLPMNVSLVSADDIVTAPPERSHSGPIELLSVGRIDREKNPMLLVEVLARLEREEPGRYFLRYAGRGPLEPEVRRHASKLGVSDRVELCGYVPFGPELLALYRRAHVFVHVSLTEGVPQVLFEALASGTPIVATDVGGVRAALDAGRAGLLVPPSDLDALVQAIRRTASDRQLSARLVRRGLELARNITIEAEAARVAAFLAGPGTEAST